MELEDEGMKEESEDIEKEIAGAEKERSKQEDLLIEAKNFLNSYKKQIGTSVKKGTSVVQINFESLAEHSPVLSENLIIKPEETLQMLELALEDSGLISNARVRFNSLSKTQEIKIKNIRSKHLGQMIAIEGIVRQASEVRPQVVSAKFECPSCGTIISVLQIGKKFKEPSRCSCGRRGGFREISKDMVDAQRIVIEESPDDLEGGEQPKRLSIFLKEDLVEPKMEEKTIPGSRVKIIGVLKEISITLATGALSTRFDLAIEANNILSLEESFEDLEISEDDEQEIKELSADPKVFERLINSIAPSVWGYPEIKEALILQLFSGVKKVRSDGTKTRGDIHILLVGDPGVAKSVMLKFISGIAPKGRYVSGKSASGAGLTATVIRDEFLRGWSLEAGAMVLSNKGVVCIDELEKMDENDRSTMHEALEQQTVTISKANVQACYSQDTKVLTEDGWKDYNEVGDLKIAQYNPSNKTIKFLPHKGLYIYNYKGKMYHFKNKRNDILVTPSHTMLTKEYRQKKFQKINAEDLKFNRISFMNSGDFIGKERKIFILPSIKHKQKRVHPKYSHQHKAKKISMDLWLEFLGYYITEGGIETIPTIGLVQNKGNEAEKMKKCLTRLTKILGCSLSEIDCGKYIRFKITQTQLYECLKKLGHKCYDKTLSLNFSELSKRQLNILFNAMMLGDGSSDGRSFSSSSKKLSNEFQAITHLIGKSASQHIQYNENYRGNRKKLFRVCISNRIEPSIKKKLIKKINYNGKVFCFSTETGFFVTKRNGKIAIQGNTLRAQTSVLAAANPKYGRFDPMEMIAKQVNLAPSLLNRFDVIFILRDLPNKERDERIATHVLSEHKQETHHDIIEKSLLRKYIAYSRQMCNPILTDEAVKEIKSFYVSLRNQPSVSDQVLKPIPISARQLEALIRMAEATARARLGKKVTVKDARMAIALMRYYLMQVGYDDETKSFDIDKISGMSASKRSKIHVVKMTLEKLENRLGKLIPLEELEKEIGEQMTKEDFEETISKLLKAGDLFRPRRGYVQLV